MSYTSIKGTVRGLHFQKQPFQETKIISCISGSIFDVALDIRLNSSTFLKRRERYISAKNHQSLIIPEGFAHGFQALEPDTILLYLHTKEYVSESEGILNVNDPRININWPLQVTNLSPRDHNALFIDETFKGI